MQSTSLLDQQNAVETAIAQFCEDARVRLLRCGDFATKRQFLLDHVEKVIFINDRITIHGSVAVTATTRALAETETGKLEFHISDQITPEEKLAARSADVGSPALRLSPSSLPARFVG